MALLESGPLASTYLFAKNLLAESATFRNVVLPGVTVPVAKDSIFYVETLENKDTETHVDPDPGPALEKRPYGIIYQQDRTLVRSGIGEYMNSGSLFFIIEALTPAEFVIDWVNDTSAIKRSKFRDRKVFGLNTAGQIEQDFKDNSGGSDATGNVFLNVQELQLLAEPQDPQEGETDENYMGWVYLATWR
ncbi:MAG: hypothetical protein O7D91_21390 [Planctomycetota bacterium]|nr:hypothetical protein [Planctomycetota bacterium]